MLIVELTDLPHLFVSHTDEELLCRFYKNLNNARTNQIQFVLAVKSSGFDYFKQMEIIFHLLSTDYIFFCLITSATNLTFVTRVPTRTIAVSILGAAESVFRE